MRGEERRPRRRSWRCHGTARKSGLATPRDESADSLAPTAEHPERERFEALAARVSQPEVLAEAQEILVHSGAVSYCAYRIVEAYNRAVGEVRTWQLPAPDALESLMQAQVEPLKDLLRRVRVESPDDLFVPGFRAA